jgi:hypothetical protein
MARLFRVALTSFVLLFLVVLAFSRALWRVNEGEAEKRVKDMVAIRQRTGIDPTVPMIFMPAWNRLKGPEPQSIYVSGVRPESVGKEIDASETALNALADSWFTLKLPFGEIDLRHWIWILPLLLWISSAYLWIARAKLKIARPENTLALDRGTMIHIAATAGLLLYFAIAAMPLWRLLEQPDNLFSIRGPVAGIFLLLTYYVAAWTLYVEARLSTDKPTLARRLVRFLDQTFVRASEGLARGGRWLATPAAAAVLASLFTAFAHNCKGKPLPGHALLHEKDAIWFAGNAFFPGSFIPHLGRIYYAITLLLAITALLFGRRLGTIMRRVFIAAALFLYVEVVFVFPAMLGFWIADLLRIIFLVIPLIFALRRGREVIRPWLIVLYLPGLVIAPLACLTIVKMEMWGVPIYFAGFSLLAIVSTSLILHPSSSAAHHGEHLSGIQTDNAYIPTRSSTLAREGTSP